MIEIKSSKLDRTYKPMWNSNQGVLSYRKKCGPNNNSSATHRTPSETEINNYGHFVPFGKRRANGFNLLKSVPLEHWAEIFLRNGRLSRISHERSHKFFMQSKGSVLHS